ncbi:hypothetical protein [Legionella drancourtii]|uniref:SnoaL-like domain-containing protein n=1 Tax=Legionella drancourtii LLAP12 TaxID=658187 RepID=G9EPW7_9GAMM|nr:hypothetical protein [Legionella drancourtii]EHL30669.1 hypothetical protein LDG_7308 [Legionella drancourtii LLAP12]
MRVFQSTLLSILFTLTLNKAYATAPLLINFTQLVAALENADDVKAIIHFDKCLVINEKNQATQTQIIKKFDGASTRFNFTEYVHAEERLTGELQDTVTTSIKISIESSTGVFLILFGQLKVFDDNTATIHLELLNPVNQKKQLNVDWLCNISNGNDNNGLLLYDFP